MIIINLTTVTTLIDETLYNKKIHESYPYTVDITKPYLQFDNRYYQFGEVKYETINCQGRSFIDTIYSTPKTYGLKLYSIYNFSTLFIYQHSFLPDYYNYKKNIAPHIHQIMLDKNVTKIKSIIDSVTSLCKKYSIENRINSDDLITEVMKDFPSTATVASTDGASDYANSATNGKRVELNDYRYANSENYLDNKSLENIYENYNDALYDNEMNKSIFWGILFFSLIAAYLLLLGKFATGINILLAAVIAGVLSIGFGLISFLVMSTTDSEKSLLVVATVYCGIAILLGYLSINSTGIPKWFRDKLALITYVSWPTFLCFLWSNFYPKGYYVPNKGCDSDQYISPSFTVEPWHYVIVGLLAITPAFLLIRKWLSKPE
jgi:hypothetical protein